MHRIDTKTAQKDKFGAGKNGFTRGNPQTGTPATDLDDDYFDMLQEELCSVVEASGASLEKGRHDQLLTALRALLLSRKNPFGDIKSDGTVQTALENLGLGTAALRDVGTGANQIPDMSSFPVSDSLYGFPGGIIHQVFDVDFTGTAGGGVAKTATFPTAFAVKCLIVLPIDTSTLGGTVDGTAITAISRTGFTAIFTGDNAFRSIKFLAIGR